MSKKVLLALELTEFSIDKGSRRVASSIQVLGELSINSGKYFMKGESVTRADGVIVPVFEPVSGSESNDMRVSMSKESNKSGSKLSARVWY